MPLTKHEHYTELLKGLEGKSLLGAHDVGDLKVHCTHTRWMVVDGYGYLLGEGKASGGQAMREAFGKVILKWVKKNPNDF